MNAPSPRMTPLVPAGCARIGPICSIPAVLAELGFDATELLSGIGFSPSLFDDPDQVMDYRDGGRLLAACAARTGCAHFGLLVGQRCSVAGLGLVGGLARAETNVSAALQTIVRYLPLFDRGGVLTLRLDHEAASLIFGVLTAGMAGADQLYDLAIAVAFNTLKDLCGSCWRPTRVTLPHRAPADPRPFRSCYGAEVRFDEAEAAIVFDRFFLGRPVAASAAAERLRLLDRAAKIESMLDMTFVERVRRELRASLPTDWLTEEEVAARLMISSRVLRLRLAGTGSSFRAIMEELRYETARQYLATSVLEFNDVALLLGYSEASAFTRAFRRWSGAPPSVWRAAQAAGRGLPPSSRDAPIRPSPTVLARGSRERA